LEILGGQSNGVCGAFGLGLIDVSELTTESVTLAKVVAHPPSLVANDDADVCNTCLHDPFQGPFEQWAVTNVKHRFGAIDVKWKKAFAFSRGQNKCFHKITYKQEVVFVFGDAFKIGCGI
jgi:hypothetical protein